MARGETAFDLQLYYGVSSETIAGSKHRQARKISLQHQGYTLHANACLTCPHEALREELAQQQRISYVFSSVV